MYPVLQIVAYLVGFQVIMAAAMFTIGLLEKRPTRPFALCETLVATGQQQYHHDMSAAMLSREFTPVGLGTQTSKTVQAYVSCWLSPDSSVCAVVEQGRVIGIEQTETCLYSPLADGRYLVSIDRTGASDVSGLFLEGRYVGVNFEQLYVYHLRRLKRRSDAVPWPAGASLTTINDIKALRAQRMVELRRAAWTDDAETHWRLTPKGSAIMCVGYFRQLFIALVSPRRWLIRK